MPLSDGDVEDGSAGEHVDSIGEVALVIVEVFHKVASHANAGLAGVKMTMDGHHRTRLDSVQHPLGMIRFGIAEV